MTTAERSTASYVELRRLLVAEGLLEKQRVFYARQLVIALAYSGTVIALIVMFGETWWQLFTAVLLALAGIWNNNFLDIRAQALGQVGGPVQRRQGKGAFEILFAEQAERIVDQPVHLVLGHVHLHDAVKESGFGAVVGKGQGAPQVVAVAPAGAEFVPEFFEGGGEFVGHGLILVDAYQGCSGFTSGLIHSNWRKHSTQRWRTRLSRAPAIQCGSQYGVSSG